jgi:hypothetical protein
MISVFKSHRSFIMKFTCAAHPPENHSNANGIAITSEYERESIGSVVRVVGKIK